MLTHSSHHRDDLPVGEVFSVGAFRVMHIRRQNEMLFAPPIPSAAVDCEAVGHGGFPFRGLAGRIPVCHEPAPEARRGNPEMGFRPEVSPTCCVL
jgi:hypothetical protein